MVKYKLVFTKQAVKDAKKLNHYGLKTNGGKQLVLLEKTPFQISPRYESLVGG